MENFRAQFKFLEKGCVETRPISLHERAFQFNSCSVLLLHAAALLRRPNQQVYPSRQSLIQRPGPPAREPLRNPSEHATCPEAHTGSHLSDTFGECHVSPSAQAKRLRPEAFRACHVSQTPKPKEPSGSIASKPRVPNALCGFLIIV